jgi:uncharacterized protein YjlB
MRIREECDIIIERHPYYESLNKKLMEDVEKVDYPEGLSYEDYYKFYAKHSSYHTVTDNIKVVNSWVLNVLRIYFGSSLSNYQSKVIQNWFAVYDRGDWVDCHNHFPLSFSFVYFVNCPRGSAPLKFHYSGKKVKAEEGKLVIFPAHVGHSVPKNKCKNRVSLIGIDKNGNPLK